MVNKLNRTMKKEGLIILFVTILCLSSVYAQINTFQKQLLNPGNSTKLITDLITIQYDKSFDDYIKTNAPLEVDIKYSMYVNSWNQANPQYRVSYCNLTILLIPHIGSNQVLYSEISNQTTLDTNEKDYFVKLNDLDIVQPQIDCKFENNLQFPYSPHTLQVYQPTWECKACQYYEWSVRDIAVAQTETRSNGIVKIWYYIGNLININFSIAIALFWIAVIFILFISISLIFLGVNWALVYLQKLTK